jgi:hypothetical protein
MYKKQSLSSVLSFWGIRNIKLKDVTVSFAESVSPHVATQELQSTLALNFILGIFAKIHQHIQVLVILGQQ